MNGCAAPLLRRLLMLWFGVWATPDQVGAAELPARADVRVIADSDVVPERRSALAQLAAQLRVRVDYVDIGTRDDVRALLTDTDLVILDAPSAHGRKELQERVIPALMGVQTPWLRAGGGRPQFGNISPLHARRLIAHLAVGGAANLKQMFGYLAAWRTGESLAGFSGPIPFPPTGIYHPSAPGPFASEHAFFEWGHGRWRNGAVRIAIAVGVEMIAGLQTGAVDMLIEHSERRGMIPIAFWLAAGDPDGWRRLLVATKAAGFVVTGCVADRPAQEAAARALGIPILKTAAVAGAHASGCQRMHNH
jgi:cobaltochelatase CobN